MIITAITEVLLRAVIGCYLVIAAVSDLREKRVKVKWMVICGIVFIPLGAASVFLADKALLPHLTGALFGGIFLLLGYVTRETVGYADGWSIVLIGLYLGFRNVVLITCIGLFAAAVFSGILLGIKKVSRKTEFPFLPFLAGGYIIWQLAV